MDPRFLSEDECAGLAARIAAFRRGGGESRVQIESWWRGTIRFARNQIQSSGDRRNNDVMITRNIEGAERVVSGNQISDVSLRALVRRAERLIQFEDETGDIRFHGHHNTASSPAATPNANTSAVDNGPARDTLAPEAIQSLFLKQRSAEVLNATAIPPEPFEHPKLLFESTLAMSSPRRAAAVAPLVEGAVKAGMLASGDIEVFATGTALMDTWGNHLYYPKTETYYTVTVRTPDGTASGWAGADGNDWSKIDGATLSDIALDKCLRSRNPVRVEPGHYTVVLEPQAVHQLFWPIIGGIPPLTADETNPPVSEHDSPQILDDRITVHADPLDPDCGFLPFDLSGNVYHKATWFHRGRWKDYPYVRLYGIRRLHLNTGLPNSGAYHMESGASTLSEMIATTQRGILVTHFFMLSAGSAYQNIPAEGYTRDGTWLIEHGTITKPIKNLKFTALHFPTFNRVEQIGPTQRVYSREYAGCPGAMAPPMKIRDFAFTALTDAV